MALTAGQTPELSKDTSERWMVENGYPCGSFKKCEKCTPSVYSKCSTWEAWFKIAWSNIRFDSEQMKRRYRRI